MRPLLYGFRPSPLQILYAFIASCIVALYWCRTQLSEIITGSTSHESVVTFQELLKQAVNTFTNNEVVAFLSVALVWAFVGILIIAIVYETVNICIVLRNDAVIASSFTHAEENKKSFAEAALVRSLLGVGFIVFLVVFFAVLAPFWKELIGQPSEQFFQFGSILQQTIGVLGLTTSLCLLWRWIIVLLPKFI